MIRRISTITTLRKRSGVSGSESSAFTTGISDGNTVCRIRILTGASHASASFHGEKEFANLIFNKEEDVDRIHARLQEIRPEIAYGYIPPADGKRRYFA